PRRMFENSTRLCFFRSAATDTYSDTHVFNVRAASCGFGSDNVNHRKLLLSASCVFSRFIRSTDVSRGVETVNFTSRVRVEANAEGGSTQSKPTLRPTESVAVPLSEKDATGSSSCQRFLAPSR